MSQAGYSWQQPSWLYHCGDGAAFLGAVGYDALRAHPDAVDDPGRSARDRMAHR
ncbi:CbrC family protein [Micromonospora sp. URMC 105]|uniref:CbrC family protein n=1 Tax=Micromonospora sp. URMC 105 TaxID=3423413 RepID=UPI003F1D1E94